MKTYVLDASLILTFLLGEKRSLEKEFIKVLRQAENKKARLCSSYLLPLEVGNGLRYALKEDFLASEALGKCLNLPIEFFIFSPVHYKRILQMSYGLKASFYDASYHFLANLLEGTFLTCDKEYFEKAKKLGKIKLF